MGGFLQTYSKCIRHLILCMSPLCRCVNSLNYTSRLNLLFVVRAWECENPRLTDGQPLCVCLYVDVRSVYIACLFKCNMSFCSTKYIFFKKTLVLQVDWLVMCLSPPSPNHKMLPDSTSIKTSDLSLWWAKRSSNHFPNTFSGLFPR